ncbi:MAG: methylated-DNA--[protein]-cysteine S-methyltransferase [Gammaproteobacteria bacterium]|nr:methylated-DNA--[protein]-cysteine S-methyltransferase [Gammaproteobacteria bacterium]
MAKRSYDAVIAAPFGRLGVTLKDGRLADIDFLAARFPLHVPKEVSARRVCRALNIYLQNPKTKFRLPLETGGSDFQRRVWRAMQRIPAGKVLSYGELARKLKTGPRAVGNACRANPIPIVIPCHRVVAANGKGGFMGKTSGRALAIKDWLLTHERGR